MRRDHDSEGLQVMVRVRPPISTEVKLNTVVTASGGVSVSVQTIRHRFNVLMIVFLMKIVNKVMFLKQ